MDYLFSLVDWFLTILGLFVIFYLLLKLPYFLGNVIDKLNTSNPIIGKYNILNPAIQLQLEKDKRDAQLQEHKGLERNLVRNTWNY